MKNTISRVKKILAIFLGTLLLGCSAKDGAVGPQGEQGPPGQDGQDGNANVIAFAWIPVRFSNNSVTATVFSEIDEAFTQEIFDTETVLVYGRDSFNTVLTIPSIFNNESYYFLLPDTLGVITFIAESVDGTSETFNLFTDLRYVIIPASNTRLSGAQEIDFYEMTYYEVMDYFGLKLLNFTIS